MRSRVLTLVMTSIVVIGLASCSKKSSTNPTPTPSPGDPNAAVTVNIPRGDGYGVTTFAPATINVTAGGTVTWNNGDTEMHTSTSTTNLWTSNITPGSSFTRRFDTRGAFSYRCTVHPGMTGEINVQ